MKTSPVFSIVLSLAVILLLSATPASAMSMSSHFPDVRPGFGSLSSKNVGGGKHKASRFGNDCSGWTGHDPDHYITVREPVKMALRVNRTSGSSNLTLVVRMTEERALCAGTGADGSRPEISAEFPVGEYEVFIGSTDQKQYPDYTLRIREDKDWQAPYGRYRFQDGGSGNFKRLQPGFGSRRTDWATYIGNEVDASRFGNGCVGWIGNTPNHIMTVRSPVKMTLRAFRGYHLLDPTLLIKTPDGRVLCDDNSIDGINPEISGEFPEGTYEVFVGSIGKDQTGDYFLIVTENSDGDEDADAPSSGPNDVD